jgi:hypothetical protein
MSVWRKYEPATRATDGPAPGARALMAWFLGNFAHQGGTNLGIYNNRTVRGGSTKSLHAEGRAVDLGINPHGAQYGTLLAERLRALSGELGIQCIIWNRQIWSGSYPEAGWRRYSGTNPHLDHLHVELSKLAAANLTAEFIQRTVSPRHPGGPAPVAQVKAPSLPVSKDTCMIIKTQPDKTKPGTLAALLSGPMFVGLGPTETPSDEQARAMGLPVLWVEYGTWQDLDRRSHALCDNPRPVAVQNWSAPDSAPTARPDVVTSSAPKSPSPSAK